MKKRLSIIIAMLLVILTITACKSNDSPDTLVEETVAVTEETGDIEDTVDETSSDTQEETTETEELTPEQEEASQDLKEYMEMLGSSEDGVYTNNHFGFSLEYPTEWYTMSQAELIQSMQAGLSEMGLDEEDMDLAELGVLMLFGTAEENPATPSGDFVSNFLINAEKLTGLNSSLDQVQYLEIVEKQLISYGYEISAIESEMINGLEFSTMELSLPAGELVIKQKFYITKIDDYMFNFVASFQDETRDQLLKIMESVTF